MGIRSAIIKALSPTPRQSLSREFIGYGTSTAKWLTLNSDLDYLKTWKENPVLRAVLEIKARAKANMIFKVKDLRSGEYITLDSRKRIDAKPLIQLLKQPNPMQTYSEWLFQREVNYGVFGRSFDYGTTPSGFNFKYDNITSIKQLPPYLTTYELTGSWIEQTRKEDIIKCYNYRPPSFATPIRLETNQVLHRSDTNIEFNDNFAKGVSKLLSLQKPLSNIFAAFESRNVIILNRGMLGMFSSEMGDANGIFPLTDPDVEKVQQAFKKYGTMGDQYQYLFSPVPLKYTKTTLNIDELKLFESVAHDAMMICHAYGVPEVLLKLYLQGATFENQEASERRLYQGTVIPESNSDLQALNQWLHTEENGLLIEGSFDHIPVLQVNEQQKANAYKAINEYYHKLFFAGNCTLAEWRDALDLPTTPEDNKRIWDLTPEQLAIIKAGAITSTTTEPAQSDENTKSILDITKAIFERVSK